MTRQERYNHVMMRGIEQGSIVRDDSDRVEFLLRMGLLAKTSGTSIYAFALMTNHAHILLKGGSIGLSLYMRRLLSGYAQYFNRRHKRVGHLFQNRYKSVINPAFKKVTFIYNSSTIKYAAYAPGLGMYLLAGLISAKKRHTSTNSWHTSTSILCGLDLFPHCESWPCNPWGGHTVIMKNVRCGWLEREYVLHCSGSREGAAREAYLAFLEEEMGIDREKEFSGGGLLRSHGGWEQVQSMRKKGTKVLSDERILGSDAFVRDVLKEAEERMALPLSADDRSRLINEDIEQECRKAGITEAFLRSGSRSGVLASMRKRLALKFVYDYGLSMAETGRRLGVTTNAVSYMARNR